MKSGSQLYESMMNLNKDDLVILFSYSRLISEALILLKHSKTVNYKTILFTDLLTQQELSYADTVIYNYRGEPSQYHSMVSSVALIDLLVIKIAQLKEDSIDKMKTLEAIREQYSYLIKR
jgi:DNA-binding MurR/RpiR family transcriptional regulator